MHAKKSVKITVGVWRKTIRKAFADLKSLAARKGVSLPTHTNPTLQGVIDYFKLSKSKDWDYDYVTYEIGDHKGDIKESHDEMKKGSDPDIKKNAADEIPTLQNHLDLAQKASDDLEKR